VKVGLVCPYDWSFPGGVRTHIAGLARELRSRRIDVEIMAPATKPEPDVFVVGSTIGVPSNGSTARISFSRSAAARIEERLAAGDIDLLHLHEPLTPSASLLALTKAGALPTVATFHAARDRSLGYRLFRPALAQRLGRIDECIAVSVAARDLIGKYFPRHYELIPNGIDATRFRDAEPDQDLNDLKPFVLFVGRLEPRKGFDIALRAVQLLRRKLNVRLLTTAPAPRNAPKWLVSVSPVSDQRLPSVLAAADVFCAPSVGGESFGLVLIEAMAAGVPVVASDLAGYKEAAGDAASLTPAGDTAECADALAEVLTKPQLAGELTRRGRARAQSFDWRVLAPRVLDVYRRASEHRMIVTRP
jgi:phosphatidylinositol alpha-mannosyltransferase